MQGNGHLYSCNVCAQAVDFDPEFKRWVHPYNVGGKLSCYPGKPFSTYAFSAPPASRDRLCVGSRRTTRTT